MSEGAGDVEMKDEADEDEESGDEAKDFNEENGDRHRSLGWFVFKIEKELRELKNNDRTPNYEKVRRINCVFFN